MDVITPTGISMPVWNNRPGRVRASVSDNGRKEAPAITDAGISVL